MTSEAIFTAGWIRKYNEASNISPAEEAALAFELLGETAMANWLEMRLTVIDLAPDPRGFHCHQLLSPSGRFLIRAGGPPSVPRVSLALRNLEKWSGRPYRELLSEGIAMFADIQVESGFEEWTAWHWDHMGELARSTAVIPNWTSFTRRRVRGARAANV